jgi:hypothetical protein
MTSCCLRAKIVNNISRNFNLCDLSTRDMQEYYMLFGIFAKDVGLYFLSVFYIALADFQYTYVYLCCVLHTYHCVPFTGECHGTAAYKAQTTSFYDVIGHRLIKK